MAKQYLYKKAYEISGCMARLIDIKTFDVFLSASRQALKKQIPKKPRVSVQKEDVKLGHLNIKKGANVYNCSVCEALISKSSYCPYCGQALDWSDT